MSKESSVGLTPFGKIISYLCVLALLGAGYYVYQQKSAESSAASATQTDRNSSTGSESKNDAEGFISPESEPPILTQAGTYTPKDGVVEIELSEYAGYAGLIAANGGLAPNENSYFFKKGGFKVKLTLSEEESWSALNAGQMAASATTVDVLAVYGRQFQVTVPAQIGFSRGADGVVTRQEIKRINDLKGQVLATAQFTEAEFFIRYLAGEAGLAVNVLENLDATPDPESVNLVMCEDAFIAGDLFLKEIQAGQTRLAGFIGWAPKTTEIVAQSGGRARLLVSNRNLLVIGDILLVNRGFAQAQPEKVAVLVEGLLEGNRLIRSQQPQSVAAVSKAFGWNETQTREELARVHFSNLPENLAFFSGAIDAAGSFSGIYQSSVLAYGSQMIKDPPAPERFLDLKHLQAVQASGLYAAEKVEIQPIRTEGASLIENDPLLSKDIRFFFEPNSDRLDMSVQQNTEDLGSIKRLLQVSPGSVLVLRGHVDDAMKPEFLKSGGQSLVNKMALKAMELSRNRAKEISSHLQKSFGIDSSRIEIVGRGWEEPVSKTSPEINRRVEVQWFTVE